MIRHFDVQQSGHPAHRSPIARHRVWLGAVIAGAAALVAFVAQTAPRESLPPAVPVMSAATVMPATTEQFQYFPQRYENQAKQVEDPIATF
jgi:hypothetical protein